MVELWYIHNYADTLAMENVVQKHFGLCRDFKYKFYDWN
jgi:hypothetical protein